MMFYYDDLYFIAACPSRETCETKKKNVKTYLKC